MTTAFISHPDCLLHEMGDWHPESAARLRAISDALLAAGLSELLLHRQAPLASRAMLEAVHDPDYLDEIEGLAPEKGYVCIDNDTYMNPMTLKAAYRAAGAVAQGVDLVVAGEVENSFCNIRPPGHHAERAQAMGFCFFNNVAVGAAHALNKPGIDKVLIVDFDLHFGNGTEQILKDNPAVMICSSFQDRSYPKKEFSRDQNNIINVILPGGTTSADFRQRISDHWFPAIDKFAPDFVLISAGFDAHLQDPFSELLLDETDYGWLTQEIVELADRHAGGRVVSSLEGGYNLNALARSALAHIRALMRIPQLNYR